MANYAIGDIQGCYEPLQRLLEHIDFNEHQDYLWLVGDLVNRGPESLAVLRFIKSLPIPAKITLGNHDLHLLGSLFGGCPWKGHDDTIHEIMHADDGEELGHWLRKQSIIYYEPAFNMVLCHAGIAPVWDLSQALACAKELEAILTGDTYAAFLAQMYGNSPSHWLGDLQGFDRLRLITNYCTRMRYCDAKGGLQFGYKGNLKDAPKELYPWYDVPTRKTIDAEIVFGHWAALEGKCPKPRIHAIDTGCLWGGQLTALRLEDQQRFSVPGLRK